MTALLIVFAGLFGAAGVVGAAMAAHGGDTRFVAIAAAIALVHAPALLALAALRSVMMPRLAATVGILIIVGTMLFSGDLAARVVWGERLFANAAPLGGVILIGAWLMTTIAGLVVEMARHRSTPPAR